MRARTKARKRALDILFEAEARGEDALSVLAARRETDDAPPVQDYAARLVEGVATHRDRIDQLIAEHADNRALLRAYDALGGHGQRFRLFIGVGVTDSACAIAEHREILAALRRGYGPEVYRIMHSHISGVKERALAEHAEAQRRVTGRQRSRRRPSDSVNTAD